MTFASRRTKGDHLCFVVCQACKCTCHVWPRHAKPAGGMHLNRTYGEEKENQTFQYCRKLKHCCVIPSGKARGRGIQKKWVRLPDHSGKIFMFSVSMKCLGLWFRWRRERFKVTFTSRLFFFPLHFSSWAPWRSPVGRQWPPRKTPEPDARGWARTRTRCRPPWQWRRRGQS